METFTIIPSSTSHITHTMGSGPSDEGIQAHIFIEKPVEDEYKDIEPLTVYLVGVNKNEIFPSFALSKEDATVIPLSVYIQLLKFFNQSWPTMKSDLEKKFKLIRRKKNPYEINASVHFYLSGTAYFERWFDDTFLYLKKCSTDFTPYEFHLQRAGKSLQLNPDVMCALSQNYRFLVNILFQAGYDHGPDYENIQS
jgi:hypothetical protein